MLSLEDAIWKELHGGYRVPYDVSVPLRKMEEGADVWDELWNELHHQGDVDLASYAAVPQLVRIASGAIGRNWNFYGLVSIIEIERHRKGNPPLPMWLKADYDNALTSIFSLAITDLGSDVDNATVSAILGVLALTKGELKLGAMLSDLDASELDEWLEERLAWSDLYELE